VAFQADFLPAPLKKELSIRVFGVDTPEKGFRAQCPSEAQRAGPPQEHYLLMMNLFLILVSAVTHLQVLLAMYQDLPVQLTLTQPM